MEISEPAVLARLPRSLHGSSIPKFGAVWGLHQGVKRKRQEVCACVDGHSVAVYEARAGKSVLSHAVPPSSTFLGTPCSLRWKENDEVKRQTYYALQRDVLRVESFQTDDGQPTARPIEHSAVLPNQESLVVKVDFLQNEQTNGTVIVIQQDGTVTLYTPDLTQHFCERLDLSGSNGQPNLLAVQILSVHEAKAAVLAARNDLTAELARDSIVLVTVVTHPVNDYAPDRANNPIFYAAWSIQPQDSMLPIRKLLEHEIIWNTASISDDQVQSVMFGPRTSTLLARTPTSLITYDLTGLIPRPLATLKTTMVGSQTLLPISATSLLVTFPQSIQLVDTTYEVVQAGIDVSRQGKRKKAGSDVSVNSLELICYFAQLRKCLIRRQNALLSVELKSSSGPLGFEQLKGRSLLVRSIGRDTQLSDRSKTGHKLAEFLGGGPGIDTSSPTNWNVRQKQLEQILETANSEVFEAAILADLQKSPLIPDAPVDFVLSKLFALGEPKSRIDEHTKTHDLQQNFPASDLVRALSHRGLLTPARVERALKSTAALTNQDQLAPDCIARALKTGPDAPGTLISYLQNDASHEIQVHTAVLKLFVIEALTQTVGELQQNLLEDQDQTISTNGESQKNQISKVHASAESLPHVLSTCLILSLERFGTLPASIISSQLRQGFSKTEILAIVQFLRQQLFVGGHTRTLHETSNPMQIKAKSSSNNQNAQEFQSKQQQIGSVSINALVKILSGCIDALGPQSLFASDEDDFIERIIPDLLTEVLITMENVTDSLALRAVLRETLRHAEAKRKQAGSAFKVSTVGQKKKKTTPRGTIITLYNENQESNEQGTVNGLPLDVRENHAVNALKVSKVGGQSRQRSVREMMMLESRLKGPYSFDRLTL